MTLEEYIVNHPLLRGKTAEQIRSWLDCTPSGQMKKVFSVMTTAEKVAFFSISNINQWYANLNQMIIDNTYEPITFTKSQVENIVTDFFSELFDYSLTHHTNLSSLVGEYFNRNLVCYNFGYCLCFSKVVSRLTLRRMAIEANNQVKRFQALGLESLPTIEEIEECLQ